MLSLLCFLIDHFQHLYHQFKGHIFTHVNISEIWPATAQGQCCVTVDHRKQAALFFLTAHEIMVHLQSRASYGLRNTRISKLCCKWYFCLSVGCFLSRKWDDQVWLWPFSWLLIHPVKFFPAVVWVDPAPREMQQWAGCLFPQCCRSSVIKSHCLQRQIPWGVLSPFVRFPGWKICCGS